MKDYLEGFAEHKLINREVTMKVPFHISKSKYRLYKKVLSKKYGTDPQGTFASVIHSALDEIVKNEVQSCDETFFDCFDMKLIEKLDL